MATLLFGPITVAGTVFDIHTLLYAAAAAIIGWQSVIFWICAEVHGMREDIVPEDPGFCAALQVLSLERLLWGSLLLFLFGLGLATCALGEWGSKGFPLHSIPRRQCDLSFHRSPRCCLRLRRPMARRFWLCCTFAGAEWYL